MIYDTVADSQGNVICVSIQYIYIYLFIYLYIYIYMYIYIYPPVTKGGWLDNPRTSWSFSSIKGWRLVRQGATILRFSVQLLVMPRMCFWVLGMIEPKGFEKPLNFKAWEPDGNQSFELFFFELNPKLVDKIHAIWVLSNSNLRAVQCWGYGNLTSWPQDRVESPVTCCWKNHSFLFDLQVHG